MTSIRTPLLAATGGLGVLVGGTILSDKIAPAVEGYIGAALLLFVLAGAAALVLRAR
jgi:hypothetical protein